jgi:hypothetical protein
MINFVKTSYKQPELFTIEDECIDIIYPKHASVFCRPPGKIKNPITSELRNVINFQGKLPDVYSTKSNTK